MEIGLIISILLTPVRDALFHLGVINADFLGGTTGLKRRMSGNYLLTHIHGM